MKSILIILLAFGAARHAVAVDSQWLTSVPQAMEQARRENKAVLLDFTGSDWCGWCKKLNAETFSKPEFIEYAGKRLVLVEVDFPREIPQSDALRQANRALQEKYDVHGFPTLVDLAPDGSVLWKQPGYLPGGPAALIAKLDGVNPKSAAPPIPATASAPPPVTRQPGDEPRLQGIFYTSSHPRILLEGKNVAEGDAVGGMRVLKIGPEKVTVEWKGKTKELTLD